MSRLLAILDLSHALASTLHEVSDPSVAEQKIHWWHEELQRFASAASRHPATLRLQRAGFDQPQLVKPLLMPMLGILRANNEERFNNAADTVTFEQRLLEDYRARYRLSLGALALADAEHISRSPATSTNTTGTTALDPTATDSTDPGNTDSQRRGPASQPVWFQQLINGAAQAQEQEQEQDNNIASPSPPASPTSPRDQLLLGLAYVDRLRRFHRLYHHGLPVWPDTLYNQVDVSAASLQQPEHRQQSQVLQTQMIDHAASLLEPFTDAADAVAALKIRHPDRVDHMAKAQYPAGSTVASDGRAEVSARVLWDDCLCVLATLRSRQLRLWQRQQLDLLQSYSTLTPLRKSWISMRQHRALRKAHSRHNSQETA